jgi:sugar lactone lactonase YvrE
MKVEVVCQYHCECGEGPLWNPKTGLLHWVDIPTGRLFEFDPRTGRHAMIHQGRTIGGFTFQENGSLLLFRDKGRIEEFKDGQIGRVIIDEVPAEVRSRWNDQAADPQGRVFCGTMPSHNKETGEKTLGRFYRLDHDGALHIIEENIGCSNGIGWSPDLSLMYYIDTPTREISVYDYDRATGNVTNRRTFTNVEGPGSPDGMTVDADGGVWCAEWGGACVKHYDAKGTLVEKIDVPTRNVTSVMFGGETLEDLYITTAIGGDKNADRDRAGALYVCRPGVKGKPENFSRIQLG